MSSSLQINEPKQKIETAPLRLNSPNKKRHNLARRNLFYGWVFLAPFFVLFSIVFIVPILVSIYRAFFQNKVSSGCGPYGCSEGAVSTFVGLDNFSAVINNAGFWQGMGRVFLFGIIQIPIMIILALALALLLDSTAAHCQKIYRLTYFLPYAIPGVIAAIVWIYLYQPASSPLLYPLEILGWKINLFDHSIVLYAMTNVTTWTYTGYNMLIFFAALQAVPPEIYEAARIDGASEWTIARRIKIPLLSSAALLAVLLSIIGTIQLFNEPAMFQKVASLPNNYMPMMMGINVKNGLADINGVTGDGPAAAISIVMAVIAGVMAMVYALVSKKVASNEN